MPRLCQLPSVKNDLTIGDCSGATSQLLSHLSCIWRFIPESTKLFAKNCWNSVSYNYCKLSSTQSLIAGYLSKHLRLQYLSLVYRMQQNTFTSVNMFCSRFRVKGALIESWIASLFRIFTCHRKQQLQLWLRRPRHTLFQNAAPIFRRMILLSKAQACFIVIAERGIEWNPVLWIE